MKDLTEAEKTKIWADVREEFPNDQMMQEVHFVRQMHYLQTEEMSLDERIRFLGSTTEKATV